MFFPVFTFTRLLTQGDARRQSNTANLLIFQLTSVLGEVTDVRRELNKLTGVQVLLYRTQDIDILRELYVDIDAALIEIRHHILPKNRRLTVHFFSLSSYFLST